MTFDYQRYLASREWSLLRERVRDRSSNHCEHCFLAPQQAVHHLTYERIGNELLSDLMAVCHPCHEWLSGKSKENPVKTWYAVSPPLTTESWQSLGYEPFHFLLPTELRSKDDVISVRDVRCSGSGCIWCTYIDPEWIFHLMSLSLDWAGAAGWRRKFRDG